MNLNIELDTIHRQFQNNKKNNDKTHDNSRFCVHNFFSINEINISEKIREIPYFSCQYCGIVEDCEFIQIAQLGERMLEKIDSKIIDREKKHVLLQYSNIAHTPFSDFLF